MITAIASFHMRSYFFIAITSSPIQNRWGSDITAQFKTVSIQPLPAGYSPDFFILSQFSINCKRFLQKYKLSAVLTAPQAVTPPAPLTQGRLGDVVASIVPP